MTTESMAVDLNMTTPQMDDLDNTTAFMDLDPNMTTTGMEMTTINMDTDMGMQHFNESIYPGYSFEQPLYMYVWPVLVLITFMANIIIILILLQKKMRNPTNIALTAIAITDSLTGLVTLPAYFMAYSKLDVGGQEIPGGNETLYYDGYDGAYYDGDYSDMNNNTDYPPPDYSGSSKESYDAFILTPSLCEWFMLSKFFLSQSFHTMSIWLTLFLGIHRCCCVKFPFKSQTLFTVRNTLVVCVVVVVLSPLLHIYHAVNEKHSATGMCQWSLEKECSQSCAYIWVSLMLKQIIPCVVLVVVTTVFISSLIRSTTTVPMKMSKQRSEENRRVSIVVAAVMVVFLIPEVPYGAFLMYAAIAGHTKLHMPLRTNREIHAAYEVMLVITFHSNFWIYTIFNRRFRTLLLATFSGSLRRVTRRLSSFASGYATSDSGKSTKVTQSGVAMAEMTPLNGTSTLQSNSGSGQSNSKTFESKIEGSVDNSVSV